MKDAHFFALSGETISEISKIDMYGEHISIQTESGKKFYMAHLQDCCESVRIVEVKGDPQALVGSPIVLAEEDSDEPPGWPQEKYDEYGTHTWTSFRLVAENGAECKIWWLGESNGYYSESVSFQLE